MTNFPAALDQFTNLDAPGLSREPNLKNAVANLNDAMEAVQSKIGLDPDGQTLFVSNGVPDAEVKSSLSTNLTGADNDLVWTSKLVGVDGDQITIEYLDPGENDAALSIDVDGYAITVNLATDSGGSITTTADDIKTELAGTTAADALVSAADKAANDGSGVVTELAATPLAGGQDASKRGASNLTANSLLFDYTNGSLYVNTGTQDAPVWSGVLVHVDNVPALGAAPTLTGVDGTGDNAAPVVGTQSALDDLYAQVDLITGALVDAGIMTAE